MKRLFLALIAVSVFASAIFAATYLGDGTYTLNVSDTIDSSNGFSIALSGVTWHYGGQQSVVLDNANYMIKYGGSTIATPSLSQGANYTASTTDGETQKNVTVTATALGYIMVSGLTANIVAPYATTQASSTSYTPPAIDFYLAPVFVSADKFEATVSWETNVSTNGNVTLMDKSGGIAIKTAGVGYDTSHSAKLQALKSNTTYYYTVKACDSTGCISSSEQSFATLPVIPQISGVTADPVSDTFAGIKWTTDVYSDSKVYYRKQGDSAWIQVPPANAIDPGELINYYYAPEYGIGPGGPNIGNPGDWGKEYTNPDTGMATRIVSQISTGISANIVKSGMSKSISTAPSGRQINFAAAGSSLETYTEPPVKLSSYYSVDITTPSGSYAINSQFLNSAVIDPNLLALISQQDHSVVLKNLDDVTTYEYKVSSCADMCVNSTSHLFTTKLTLTPPQADLYWTGSDVPHGTSVAFEADAKSLMAGGTLTNAYVTWTDEGTTHTYMPKWGGDPLTFVPGTHPDEAVFSLTFTDTGTHDVTLYVTDSFGLNSTKTATINVKATAQCAATAAKYYPSDTPCTDKWPNNPGATIDYNSGIGACHAFEVCDDNLDYMAADAETCCNGDRAFSNLPEQNWGYGYDKAAACDDALAFTQNSGGMKNLSFSQSMKMCKAAYLVKGIGSRAIYVKDYYTGETCCANNNDLCPNNPSWQAYDPWPASNIHYNQLWCFYTHYNAVVKSWNEPKTGWYASDTDPHANNNAMMDAPAHTTVNIMNTGTCVDYSFVVTTALRKIGFKPNEIMSMRTPGHLYNAVWLPGAKKYSFIDTVGNSGGEFFTGPGWSWSYDGDYKDHCYYNSDRCSNDQGPMMCPDKSKVSGC